MTTFVYPNGQVTLTVPAGSRLALFSDNFAQVLQNQSYANVPISENQIAYINNAFYTSSVFSSATSLTIVAGASPVYYEIGTDATVKFVRGAVVQGSTNAVNATATLTPTNIYSGIITSSTAAAVTATLPTGAVMELSSTFAVADAFDWSVINTGANAFTVAAAASGHTVVGNMVVAAGKAARFRTAKTADQTFVTYSLSNT